MGEVDDPVVPVVAPVELLVDAAPAELLVDAAPAELVVVGAEPPPPEQAARPSATVASATR
ncbi:MAG: hypothetical protein ACRD0L_15955 [Acidimicrobiales bacterium]